MKSLRLIQFRRSVEAGPLPAALAGLLLVALLLQAALPIEAELPPIEAGRPAPSRRGEVYRIPIPDRPAILARDMFAPSRDGGAASGGEVRLLGLARSGSASAAILSGPGGAVTLRPGQSVGGFRLVGIGRDSVVLDGTGGRKVLRIGQGSAPAAAASSAEESEQ